MDEEQRPLRRKTDQISKRQRALNRIPRSVEAAFIYITIVFVATVAGFAWIIDNERELVRHNEDRIEDIQVGRTEGCERIYTAFSEVFELFVPPEPRTQEQQATINAFNTKISALTSECVTDIIQEENENE